MIAITFILWLVFFSFLGVGNNMKRLAIVHSYHKGYFWSEENDAGIAEGLFQGGYVEGDNLEVIKYYMRGETENLTPEAKEKVGDEIFNSIIEKNTESKIDLAIIADDYAFYHVGRKLYKEMDIVFVGINEILETYNSSFPFFSSYSKPSGNVTGVWEYIPFVESFLRLNQLAKLSGRTVMLIFDTGVGQFFKNGYLLDYSLEGEALGPANITIEQRIVTTIAEFQAAIDEINSNPKYSSFFPCVFTLLDKDGSIVPSIQVRNFNPQKPSFAFSAVQAEQGITFGITYDSLENAVQVGIMASDVLKGKKIGDIPIVLRPRKSVFFNLDETDRLGIHVPQSWRERAKFLYRKPNYSSLFISIFLSVISSVLISVIVLIIVVIFFTIFISIQKKKIFWIQKVTNSLVKMKFKDKIIVELESTYKKQGRIGKVLFRISKLMESYKPFIPTQLFNSEGSEPKSEFSSLSKEFELEEGVSSSSSKYDVSSSTSSESMSSLITSERISTSTTSKTLENRKMLRFMHKKDLTLMICKLKNLNIKKMETELVLKVMNCYLQIVVEACNNTGGDVVFVNGETVCASWNCSRIQINHANKAADCAIEIRDKIFGIFGTRLPKKLIQIFNISSSQKISRLQNLQIQISLCSFNMFYGNIGSESTKFFTLCGNNEYDLANTINEKNGEYGTLILLNLQCAKSLKYSHAYKAVFDPDFCIFQLLYNKEGNENKEWMYQIQDMDKKEKFKRLNTALMLFHTKKYMNASSIICSFLVEFPNDQTAKKLKEKIGEVLDKANNKSQGPVSI